MRTLLLVLLVWGSIFISSPCEISAQFPDLDPSTAGRHFVIAFPDIGDGAENLWRPSDKLEFDPSLYLYLYSAVPNTATITSPVGGVRNIPLSEGTFERVDILELNGGITKRTGEILGNGITVRTTFPVIAYCYMETTSGSDMWTPIPVENWGLEYSCFTFPGQVLTEAKREPRGFMIGSMPVPAPAGIMVLAAYDNTRITISPRAPLEGNPALSVTLNAGEVYQVQSTVDTSEARRSERQPSLQGTRITATQPIGVLSGNTRFMPLDDLHTASDNTIKNLFYEWLAPVNTLGSEFAYTPTWDARRQLGDPGEDYSEKRSGESLFICGVLPGETEGTYRDMFTDGESRFTVEEKELHKQYMAGQARPGYLRTSQPTQVFVAPSPVSIGKPVALGMEYETYGSYVAEVVPVEQWSNFAPFTAPITAKPTEHYLNIVTRREWKDSIVVWSQGGVEQEVIFNRGTIPGTDFEWGTMSLVQGKTYYLRGRGAARFSGTVYGFGGGSEVYRTETYNPEYLVYIQSPGIVYGYTLSPRRNVAGPPDSIVLETTRECASLNVSARITSGNPAGLRSVALAPGAANTQLRFIAPATGELNGFVEAEFVVEPINANSNASADVIITDRTGAQTILPYSHTADNFIVTSPQTEEPLEFTPLGANIDTADYLIRAVNEGEEAVAVHAVELADGSSFSIAELNPPLPITLAPGEEIKVAVLYPAADNAARHRDTLRFLYGCGGTRTIPLYGRTETPCINLTDLDFGVLEPGESRTLPLLVRNTGEGFIYFRNNGQNPVLGLDNGFSTDAAPFDGADSYGLDKGASITVDITFTATDTGEFRGVLRFASTWHGCQDSSVLTARVRSKADTTTTGIFNATEESFGKNIPLIVPNPFSGNTSVAIDIDARGPIRLEILDLMGTPRALLLEGVLEPGTHALQWSPGDLPSGIYYARLRTDKQSYIRRVVFIR